MTTLTQLKQVKNYGNRESFPKGHYVGRNRIIEHELFPLPLRSERRSCTPRRDVESITICYQSLLLDGLRRRGGVH